MLEGGLRLKGKIRKPETGKPLVTIVTVVYNGARVLENTIRSVLAQTYDNCEYVLVDGGSADATLDIVKKYEDRIDYWISEPDKGIYDAMNKSLALVTGDWINFMNAGDVFYTDRAVEEMFAGNGYESAAVLYGDVVFDFPEGRLRRNCRAPEGKPDYTFICHQAVFCSTALLRRFGFDTQFRIAADYHFFYTAYHRGHVFRHIPAAVVIYEADEGISSVRTRQLYLEDARITGRIGQPGWKLRYWAAAVKDRLRGWLPERLRNKIRYRRMKSDPRFTPVG